MVRVSEHIYRPVHVVENVLNYFFHNTSYEIRFSVPVEPAETAIFNSGVENLQVGLQIAVSTRSKVTSNQILKRIAMKNKMHYSKQNTADATGVTAALASLGSKLHTRCNRCVSSLVMQYTIVMEFKQ